MTAILGHLGSIGSLAGGTIGRLVASGLILGMGVATMVTTATGALFNDTQSVGANTFSTGTVDISTTPTSAVVTFSDMAPGDKVTNSITASNDGSLQLRYAIKSTTTESVLAAALDMTIKTGVSTCTNGGFGVDGTVISGPADLGSTGGLNVVGDPASGADTGDRTLNASANEVLCVQVELPLAAANTAQGLTSTAILDFIADQTKNN